MFQAMGEKALVDFVEKADLNKNGIKDKKEIEAIAGKVSQAAVDAVSAVDGGRVAKALEVFDKAQAVLFSRIDPLLKKDGLDVSEVIAALAKADAKKALGDYLGSIKELGASINHEQLQKGLKEFGEAKELLDAFTQPAPPKKK